MICRFVDLSICRFADLSIFVETSPQPPSKGEPIHEHYTNDYEQHTNDYEDYISNYEDYTLTH